MSTQAAPVIPPRPARSPQPSSSLEMPKIPPRPGNRRNDRSVSPMRGSYAPSPFNEWTGPSMSRTVSNDPPPRPPSVTIPSLGEEGIEYADLDPGNVSDSHHQTPAETRNVSSDLKIHAPRPSLPISSAEAKVQAVTRTDSRQAAAAGLGRGVSPAREEQERSSRSLNSRASGTRAESSTASNERRLSSHHGEEQGFRVPMYPNAGDVQAPSPSPFLEGSQRTSRNHNRTRSARDSSLPPGSYGLHGHGVQHPDKFEKAWYEKHPDEFVREEGQYGPGVTPRPDWAMSSDDLNKIVRSSAQTGSGLGTSPTVVGTPEEEVGYIASDEYIHSIASPPLDARLESQPAVESPLRQMTFPSEGAQKQTTASPLRHRRSSSHGHREGGVIHVDDPMHPLHHPDGFAPTPALEDHEPTYENAEEEEEPILAADEIRPESAYLHPAVSPTFDRRASFEDDGRSRTPSVHSRSNSRSASAQGQFPVLTRYDSREDTHTPLEDVEEYEPLFPEDDAQKEKTVSAADRFKKRPDTLKHRFPSQDIWEDAPNSLQLHATVTTPDLPKRDSSEIFETPEQEATRRMQSTKVDSHQVATHILEGESIKDKLPPRPETLKQRFPSRDIWEDAPDSHQLVTTVEPAKEELKSPEVPSRPGIPPRPQRLTQSTSPTEKRQPPTIPDRPKPQFPNRPAKPGSRATASSAEAPREAPAVKAKPAIPARPGGSKIAAMKAGFLTDLNSRLQLGPQQPKPQEKEPEETVEKQPLSDARKGRARGPARRKPAVVKPTSKLPTIPEIKITESLNVWQVGQDGSLVVGTGDNHKSPIAVKEPSVFAVQPMAPPIARNTAGEFVDPTPEPPAVEDVTLPATTTADVQPLQTPAETSEPAESSPTATESSDKQEKKDGVDVKPSEPVSEPAVVAAAMPESVSTPAKLNDALEDIAASADGKRKSDGSIHPEE
ncbi:uncharacterized protein N7500_008147 [Penicillium coprophilum]|uniref:uncharacterized protein n=1 Tax=Penicillium coprophilum TaxID=36646 RepID=UPI0023A6322F|nr:uncharacterized protein N7500_008147 [Penicillium coprophilum]KAJ5158496.1 hypothetical protein N7500_008147 [Penicillium coprophilum]